MLDLGDMLMVGEGGPKHLNAAAASSFASTANIQFRPEIRARPYQAYCSA